MGRTRRKNLLAERVARFLYHVTGQMPALCEDFRHADRGAWGSPVGGHRVTKNGDPTPAEPLGDHDGRALDFDGSGSGQDLSLGDLSALDFAANKSFSEGAFFSTTKTGNDALIATHQDRNTEPGHRLIVSNSGKVLHTASDGAEARAGLLTSTDVTDGAPHLAIASVDRVGGNAYMHLDGAREGTADYSAVGSVANDLTKRIGATPDGSERFPGMIALALVHPQWIAEQQCAYLDALLRDRTVDVPDLPVYGSLDTGYKRRLPSYLTDAFGADGPDFWWAADRHYHHDPAQDPAVTQLPDFAGSNFAVQRTGSNKPNASGSGGYGDRLDHVSYEGDDHVTHRGYTQDAQTVTWTYRLTQDSGQSGTVYVASHYDGGTAEISLEYEAGNNRYAATIVDGSSTTVVLTDTTSGIDPTDGYHTVSLRVDAAGDHALRVDGSEADTDATALGDLTATTRQTGARNGSNHSSQNVHEQIMGETALSDSALTALEASL